MTHYDEELDLLAAKVQKRANCTFEEALQAAKRLLEKRQSRVGANDTIHHLNTLHD